MQQSENETWRLSSNSWSSGFVAIVPVRFITAHVFQPGSRGLNAGFVECSEAWTTTPILGHRSNSAGCH